MSSAPKQNLNFRTGTFEGLLAPPVPYNIYIPVRVKPELKHGLMDWVDHRSSIFNDADRWRENPFSGGYREVSM
jgi:hypothetical protein